MKTAEEILSPLESKGEIFDRRKVLWLMALAMSERESEVKAQFQPTEKTREGAIKDLQNADIIISGTGNLTKPHRREAVAIIDFLIHKGINLEPYSQTENTNTPTLQSDSVDAEALHDIFYKKYLSYMEHEPEGCMKKAFIETVLSSKVKPVNEITEALNNIKSDLEADISLSDEASPFVKDAIEKINTLLSTAPDDGWISVKEHGLPKKEGRYMVYGVVRRVSRLATENGIYLMDFKDGKWDEPLQDDITHWKLPNPPKN